MTRRSDPVVRDLAPADALRLVGEGRLRILDVRTPEEYQRLGHIPGALLLPVDLVPAGAATLPRDGRPLLICCEHGMRSAHAARFLARAGFENLLNLSGGMSCWQGPREHSPGDPYGETGPSSWLVENADLLPRGGWTLDLACGTGRHALLLAAAGFRVRAVDREADTIDGLRAAASRLELPVEVERLDLEVDGVDLGVDAYDLVLGIHYLHRPLFPALIRALRPGGILLYETFTTEQARRGHPRNPAFLLGPGELRRLVGPLEILREQEGESHGRMVAGVVARKAPLRGDGRDTA